MLRLRPAFSRTLLSWQAEPHHTITVIIILVIIVILTALRIITRIAITFFGVYSAPMVSQQHYARKLLCQLPTVWFCCSGIVCIMCETDMQHEKPATPVTFAVAVKQGSRRFAPALPLLLARPLAVFAYTHNYTVSSPPTEHPSRGSVPLLSVMNHHEVYPHMFWKRACSILKLSCVKQSKLKRR